MLGRWMDKELMRMAMAIATGMILYVMFGYFTGQIYLPHGDPDLPYPTPVVTMLVHENGSLNYTFTIAGVTYNDLIWSDFQVDVRPNPMLIKTPSDTDLVSSGDGMTITFSSEVETVIQLKYLPTGGIAYSLVFTPLA
jgi:hypothetical protein